MCGLFGVYSPHLLSVGEKENLEALGVVSHFRGVHSTGVASVRKEWVSSVVASKKKRKKKRSKSSQVGYYDYTYDVKKAMGAPATFVSSKSGQEFIHKPKTVLLMGHSRAATVGNVDRLNAHPVRKGHIIGSHNGTISTFDHPKLSDTHILYDKISKVGLEEALREVEEANGAYALSFIDTKENTLNFIRNSKRPLHFCKGNGSTMYWSSAAHYLSFAIHQARAKWTASIPSTFETKALPVYTLYSYKIGASVMTPEITDLSHIEVKESKVYGGYCTSGGNYGDNGYEDKWWKDRLRGRVKSSFEAAREAKEKQDKVILLPPSKKNNPPSSVPSVPPKVEINYITDRRKSKRETRRLKEEITKDKKAYTYHGYRGMSFSIQHAEKCLSKGCGDCGQVKEVEDVVHWNDFYSYLCGDCVDACLVNGWVNESNLYESFLADEGDEPAKEYMQ